MLRRAHGSMICPPLPLRLAELLGINLGTTHTRTVNRYEALSRNIRCPVPFRIEPRSSGLEQSLFGQNVRSTQVKPDILSAGHRASYRARSAPSELAAIPTYLALEYLG